MASSSLHLSSSVQHSTTHQWNKATEAVRYYARKWVDILGRAVKYPFVQMGAKLKEHARKNIGKANEKVEEAQSNLAYLKSVYTHIEQTIQGRMALIQAKQTVVQRDIALTQANIQKLHGEITQKSRWSFPGKKAALKRSYEALSKTLTTQHQKAQALEVQHASLQVRQRQVQALTPTIQREEVYLGTLTATLNPQPLPDTVTWLRGIAASFSREHTHMLALSTIQIGNLGMQLMHTYQELEKSANLVSTSL